MKPEFYQIQGDVILPQQLLISKARQLASSLESNSIDFAKLIECRKNDGNEIIIFDVEIEVPQIKVHPIFARERIAVEFYSSDKTFPEVLALRTDFPKVPHLNFRNKEFPRSICLYDQIYEDIKREWTAPRFINRIREWLRLTAIGKLHPADQPLEPFILGDSGYIVLPHDISYVDKNSEMVYISDIDSMKNNKWFLKSSSYAPISLPAIVSIHRCIPKVHGLIYMKPNTLEELARIVGSAGLGLITELRERLMKWKDQDDNTLNSRLILLILFPKMRTEGGVIENVDRRAFFILDNIYTVGLKIGIWERKNPEHVKDQRQIIPITSSANTNQQMRKSDLATILIPDPTKRGEDIYLLVLNVLSPLTRQLASYLNGRTVLGELKIASIGMGALGSQVVMNFARSGYGAWKLIDHDILLPHNVARHALTKRYIGKEKSTSLALIANDIIADSNLFSDIPIDILSPPESGNELSTAFLESDSILDMSASVAVARKISCDVVSVARRLSFFLSPTGRDSILLAEDAQRKYRLDALEMQYYRAIINDKRLIDHLTPAEGQSRYGQSCRDITSQISQYLVALHSAIGSMAIERAISHDGPSISIWRSDDLGNVLKVDLKPERVILKSIGDWKIIVDDELIRRVNTLRRSKLPKETGGVLIGSFDLGRKNLYIVDALRSPPDSEEWPTVYIRGCEGLQKAVQLISKNTQEMLNYVGEWHSHPKGFSTAPSYDDLKVFEWITDCMNTEGLPPVMMIVGAPGRISLFVNEITTYENLL